MQTNVSNNFKVPSYLSYFSFKKGEDLKSLAKSILNGEYDDEGE